MFICPSCLVVVNLAVPPGTGRSRPSSGRRRRLLEQVIARDGLHCHLCGLLVDLTGTGYDRPTLDHVIPRGEGGSHRLSNLRMAHAGCNHMRDRLPLPIPDELRERLRRMVRNRRRRKQREARERARAGVERQRAPHDGQPRPVSCATTCAASCSSPRTDSDDVGTTPSLPGANAPAHSPTVPDTIASASPAGSSRATSA